MPIFWGFRSIKTPIIIFGGYIFTELYTLDICLHGYSLNCLHWIFVYMDVPYRVPLQGIRWYHTQRILDRERESTMAIKLTRRFIDLSVSKDFRQCTNSHFLRWERRNVTSRIPYVAGARLCVCIIRVVLTSPVQPAFSLLSKYFITPFLVGTHRTYSYNLQH